MARQEWNVLGQVVDVAVVRTRVDQFDDGAVGRRVRELRVEPEGFKPAHILPTTGELHVTAITHVGWMLGLGSESDFSRSVRREGKKALGLGAADRTWPMVWLNR